MREVYKLVLRNEIESMTRSEAHQHLRAAYREIEFLRMDLGHWQLKAQQCAALLERDGKALEYELTRIPVEGVVE